MKGMNLLLSLLVLDVKKLNQEINMFDISTVQLDWQGLNLKLETGLMARQADGAVVATLGSTRCFALFVLQNIRPNY